MIKPSSPLRSTGVAWICNLRARCCEVGMRGGEDDLQDPRDRARWKMRDQRIPFEQSRTHMICWLSWKAEAVSGKDHPR